MDLPDLILPHVPEWASPIWHIFTVRHPQRNELQEHLKNMGVGTLIHYPVPPHLSGAYSDLGMQAGRFPIAEEIASTILSLPMGPHLNGDDIEYVTSMIREYIHGK